LQDILSDQPNFINLFFRFVLPESLQKYVLLIKSLFIIFAMATYLEIFIFNHIIEPKDIFFTFIRSKLLNELLVFLNIFTF